MTARHALVTGAAGFIGSHVAHRLLDDGFIVTGFDNFDPYYDPALKRARAARLTARPGFSLVEGDLRDAGLVGSLFAARPERVVHLAGQAGVRYSLENPRAFLDSNLLGFLHILEGCVAHGVGHLIYASSSSIYGANTALPYGEHHVTDHPVSFYAATKKANELMAHAYAHLHLVPMTGLRFFTVFGPWGRPDMAYYSFTRDIIAGRPIKLHNNGAMSRDFTYVDDIVEAIARLIDHLPTPARIDASDDPGRSHVAPHRVYNIGNDRPVELSDFLRHLEHHLGRTAIIEPVPIHAGEVLATWADVSALKAAVGWAPSTPIDVGIGRFVAWYRSHHGEG